MNWLYRYRIGDRTTSPNTIVLGGYPDLSLAKARKKRDECRAWLADDKDPKFEIALAIDTTPAVRECLLKSIYQIGVTP